MCVLYVLSESVIIFVCLISDLGKKWLLSINARKNQALRMKGISQKSKGHAETKVGVERPAGVYIYLAIWKGNLPYYDSLTCLILKKP